MAVSYQSLSKSLISAIFKVNCAISADIIAIEVSSPKYITVFKDPNIKRIYPKNNTKLVITIAAPTFCVVRLIDSVTLNFSVLYFL